MMVALSRCLALPALLASSFLGVDGARIARKPSHRPSTKFISGVPVLNYDLAYGDEESLAEVAVEDRAADWVVVAKPGTSETLMHSACQHIGCKLAGHPSSGGVPFFSLKATEKDLAMVLDTASGIAQFAEPDFSVTLAPDMQEATVEETASWGLSRIGAPLKTTSGKGVHVYVLDTGIRVTHVDFGGRAITTLDLSTGGVTECNGDATCAGDVQGHGSHCAGTVGGNTYGVAPAVNLHAVKVLSDSGGGQMSWSYSALDWVAASGERPRVASMSLGGKKLFANGMKTAVTAAVDAGVVVVVAGGNDNSDACGFSPAFVPAAITVGSTTSTDERSSFSNYGKCTDIWAPGSAITSVGIASDTAASTFSGTSMACPHVSGGAALLLQSSPAQVSSDVLTTMLSDATSGGITGLTAQDTNKLLWVGAGSPPPVEQAPDPVCPFYCGPFCLLTACKNGCTKCA